MSSLRSLAKLMKYIQRFGMLRGAATYARVDGPALVRSSEPLTRVVLPGYAAPVFLREGADRATFWQVLVEQQYNMNGFPHFRELQQAYNNLLNEGRRPVIVDAGANIGLSTIWFAQLFPEAVIVAVEPETGNCELLARNVASYPNVQVVHGGLWSHRETLAVSNPGAGSAAFQVNETHSSDGDDKNIRGYTVDELVELVSQGTLFAVKIDIEGAQKQVFKANTDWVGRADLIIMELEDWLFPWQGTSTPFFRCISAHQFEYLIQGENIFCFRDIRTQDQPQAVTAG